ncbi:uncharacterized protein TNCV_4426011 [Trichonephila clavipes]|nr:uncharacterized protein TNCV_4426011 [Trichonephila clavipes]
MAGNLKVDELLNAEKYWVRCVQFKVRPGNQITAPLPENRIQAEFSFETVGIDFAGPIYTKNDEKAYMSLFTCAVTRAIYREVASSLSTGHFLLAFRRFIARRGICHTVNSDNARTSKSAELNSKDYMNICEPVVQNYFGKKGEEKVPLDNCGDLEGSLRSTRDEMVK